MGRRIRLDCHSRVVEFVNLEPGRFPGRFPVFSQPVLVGSSGPAPGASLGGSPGFRQFLFIPHAELTCLPEKAVIDSMYHPWFNLLFITVYRFDYQFCALEAKMVDSGVLHK